MTNSARDVLTAIVEGDVLSAALLETWPDEQFGAAAADLALTLSARTVAQVLRDHHARRISSASAQRWASFVKYGVVVGRPASTAKWIDIDYELVHEDAIVDAVGRLEELGDLVDGELHPGETAELLRALTREPS